MIASIASGAPIPATNDTGKPSAVRTKCARILAEIEDDSDCNTSSTCVTAAYAARRGDHTKHAVPDQGGTGNNNRYAQNLKRQKIKGRANNRSPVQFLAHRNLSRYGHRHMALPLPIGVETPGKCPARTMPECVFSRRAKCSLCELSSHTDIKGNDNKKFGQDNAWEK